MYDVLVYGLPLDYHVSAAFDFAVDPEGLWIFLECNESGQFLFLESSLPDMPVLDAFCRWFCELIGVPEMDRVGKIRLSDYRESGCWERESQDENRRRHNLGVVVNRLMVETDGPDAGAEPL